MLTRASTDVGVHLLALHCRPRRVPPDLLRGDPGRGNGCRPPARTQGPRRAQSLPARARPHPRFVRTRLPSFNVPHSDVATDGPVIRSTSSSSGGTSGADNSPRQRCRNSSFRTSATCSRRAGLRTGLSRARRDTPSLRSFSIVYWCIGTNYEKEKLLIPFTKYA
jgi:hypothetical protein